MIGLVRSEWIKARTVRSHLVLVIIAVAIPLLISGLTMLLTGDVSELGDELLTGLITGSGVLTALLLGVVASLLITQEQAHGTLRVTFAASPARLRVVVAKVLVTALAAAAVALVVAVVCGGLGTVVAQARDGEAMVMTAPIAAFVVYTALIALIGLGLGMLVRNAPVSIVILIAWPLLVENLVGALLMNIVDEPFRWLPFNSGVSSILVDMPTDGWGRVGGLVYLGVWALAVLVAGALVTARSDT